jgi:hypothetical protein
MKRFILCFILVFSLAQFSYLVAQDEQVVEEQFPLNLKAKTGQNAIAMTDNETVEIISATFVDSYGDPLVYANYPDDSVYMQITCINNDHSAKTVRFEYNLTYADGSLYYTYRTYRTVSAGYYYSLRVLVSNSRLYKLGLFSFTGRIYGTAMGNTKIASSQLCVY